MFPISKRAIAPTNAPKLPPIHRQALNYAKAQAVAAVRIIKAEQVLRSREETARLVETHCKGHGSGEVCEFYRFSDGRCGACGCPVYKRAARIGLGCPKRKFA
jgi:hypothetical protein